MSEPLPYEKSDAAKREEETLAFWQEKKVFEQSLELPGKDGKPREEFVFYDGPPFATGLPHSGSLLSSVSKDLFPRYKTMRGYRVRRRWGWDTHGLPIEILVEKKLGLKNKKETLALGIETFNEAARALVLEYVQDWKRYVDRVGRWVDFDDSYKTLDPAFMESVWWGLKQIHEKKRLYEGRKVLMYCPHCETPLAKAEIAMDNTYKDITEESATVMFKVVDPTAFNFPPNTYFLAWTTTPWTLPGNVGLAVGADISYGLYEHNGVTVIVATELAEKNGLGTAQKTLLGKDLVGSRYEPLYEIPKVVAHTGKKWEVLAADFVTTTDGTGIVHTAVIYGEDDYALGVNEGLPMVPILNPNGTYNDDAPEFIRGQYIKKAEAPIKADLESRGLLFSRIPYKHSYPHCYRCGTPLIYNAVSSWFIDIQSVKDTMLAQNKEVTWMPDHLKHGRFQKNLESAPDWTISRNRFWATPLPIWKDAAGKVTVIGSIDELKARTKKSGNTYFTMRHGEAENNLLDIYSTNITANHHLTEKGRADAAAGAQTLVGAGIDLIVVSPFTRTRETAEIVRSVIDLPLEQVIVDERLSEINVDGYEGKPLHEYLDSFSSLEERFQKVPAGETLNDVRKRVGELLYELEAKHAGKKILIVSHGDTLWMLKLAAGAVAHTAAKNVPYPVRAQVDPLDFTPVPHNRDYELDLHLPYIDEIQLYDEEGTPLTRIPEVVDCWVESGSMPFAEYHYPFENKEEFEKRTPGDFVSEYIGQTRAWFYYMHAMGVELFDKAPFKNVVTTGTILASDGNKLSKSLRNYTDPYILFDRFSADAFRYYLMSSVLMQAEDLQFRDDDVKDVQNRVVNMLRNVLAFYNLFKEESVPLAKTASANVLDTWILSRLNEVTQNATDSFDRYDVPHATRPLRDFIDDLSTWYVRRSRDRVKGSDTEDAAHALATLRTVLTVFSKVIAPVMPYVAEEIFQAVRTDADPKSVHLCEWPTAGAVDLSLSEDMARVRAIASEGLKLRQLANIKVRQPLQALRISGELSPALADILMQELNVKEVISGASETQLDTDLTPDLIREGDVRGFMRALAEARKEAGLAPKDRVALSVDEKARVLLEGTTLPGVATITEDTQRTHTHQVDVSTGSIAFSLTTLDAT
jgi:isoleucyl-tRNA synthetase